MFRGTRYSYCADIQGGDWPKRRWKPGDGVLDVENLHAKVLDESQNWLPAARRYVA